MILRVAVDQRESIRRGFNCHSTMTLEVDIPNTPKDIVEYIADHFKDGNIMAKSSPNQMIRIPQPNLDGFYEAIRKERGQP